MDVSVLTMNTLFQKNIQYLIPEFQRPYVWNQEDQWEPLWDDVRNIAEEFIEGGKPIRKSRTHFLGAVVIQQQPFATGKIESRLVIDGQQRLTTAQLLLDAVQEVMERRCLEDISERLKDLVLNSKAYVARPDDEFKVWPTLDDRDAFRQTMKNDLPSKEFGSSLIVQAHEFFKLQIEHWLDELPEATETRADALESVVVHLLELVVIDLDIEDEPHIIFETLNARGTPLLQSDLIKNMVLHEAKRGSINSDVPNESSELWGFNDEWWRKEIGRGRNRDPRIEVFLNYWLIMRMQKEVRPDRTSTEFRDYVKISDTPIKCIAADIQQVSETYRSLEEKNKRGFKEFLYRREILQVGTLTPVLLWLFSTKMVDEQMSRAVLALESYLVRRMVCRMTTKNYNTLFLGLVNSLEKAARDPGDTVVEYLSKQKAYANIWPDDRALRNAFLTLPLYRSLTRARLRLVLEAIEEKKRSVMAESQSVPRRLTIEHVMPQKWQDYWPLPTIESDVEKAVEMRDNRNNIIHTIGNLTLVNKRLNPKLSNASWPKKRKELGRHSILFLNKRLLEEAPLVWNEDTIAERAKRLSKLAAQVWPSAEQMSGRLSAKL